MNRPTRLSRGLAAAFAMALSTVATIVALPTVAKAEETYVLGADSDPLVVLCKADAQRCRTLLAERMEQLRGMLEEEREIARRGLIPELGEAGRLAQQLTSGVEPEERDAAARRLAWLAHRHRWVHPIPQPLELAVGQAWSSPTLTHDERRILADAAMTLGHPDALDLLVARLSGPGPAPVETIVGAPPPAQWLLLRHTDAPRQQRAPEALVRWLVSHRPGLRFDRFVRRWRTAAGPQSP